MTGNALKTPFTRSLNMAAQRRALDAIQLQGKALPASVVAVSGSIVTVKFELSGPYTLPPVTCPLFGPEYIRYPVQIGDAGVVFPADAYLGGVSGLGGGVADLTIPANLSALVFFPVANKAWSAPDNANAVVIYGPDGVVLRDSGAACKLVLTPSGVTITGNLSVTGTVTGLSGTSNSIGLTTHRHAQGNDSRGDVEQPVNAPTPGT
jgi:hypothetical protein